MTELDVVLDDLTADGDQLDRLVADLDAYQWRLPTPAPGWTIADQIAHLTFIFRLAAMAATDPKTFAAMTAGAQRDFDGAVNAALKAYQNDSPDTLLAKWRAERKAAVAGLAAVPAGQTVPWLVNPLPPVVLACAGIMEQFAHGQDIADTLGVTLERTDRLRHLVGFAVLTRDFGYLSRGADPAVHRVPLRDHRTFRRAVDLRAGGLRAADQRPRGGLLPAGDPAAAPRRRGGDGGRRRGGPLAGHRPGVPGSGRAGAAARSVRPGRALSGGTTPAVRVTAPRGGVPGAVA